MTIRRYTNRTYLSNKILILIYVISKKYVLKLKKYFQNQSLLKICKTPTKFHAQIRRGSRDDDAETHVALR